ncbi:MAG: ATP-binding protein [Rubricoccaceae bacterium]|nr:ATP-binding protein [Rubricoccaceae bacterium]
MPGSSPSYACRFRDLDTIVDEVHALFAGWARAGTFAETLDASGIFVAQLAVHEWVANLVQHAAFGGRAVEIDLSLTVEAGGLRCVIEDNSDGFDFEEQVDRQERLVQAPEPSERGRGLLMLIACAEDLRYESAGRGRQRIAFVVPASLPPERLLSLFPPDHLRGDAAQPQPAGPTS